MVERILDNETTYNYIMLAVIDKLFAYVFAHFNSELYDL